MILVKRSSVTDAAAFEQDFSSAPEKLRENQYFFGLPSRSAWQMLLKMPYPKPREFWLAYDDGLLVGRIGASVSVSYPGCGAIGFFEVSLDDGIESASKITTWLFEAAETWLREQGVRQVYGPMNYNTWFQHRFRVEPGSDPYAFEFEPHHPPEYVTLFKQQGYKTTAIYRSEGLESFDSLEAHAKKAFEKTTALGWSYVSVDPENFLQETVPLLYQISMVGFSKNYLFEPISQEGFTALYGEMPKKVDLRYSQMMLAPDGKTAGFALFLVDQDHLMLKTIAVLPQYQGQGASNAVIYPATLLARPKIKHFAGVMFKADNRSSSYTRHGKLLWEHNYELLDKQL